MSKSASLLRIVRKDVLPVRPSDAVAIVRKPLGQILLERGMVDPGDLLKAAALRDRQDLPLGDILLAHGWVREDDLIACLAEQWGCRSIDPKAMLADPRLIDLFGADRCLATGLLPYRRLGGAVIVATSRPEAFEVRRAELEERLGPVIMALAMRSRIEAAIASLRAPELARAAEIGLDAAMSCRSLLRPGSGRLAVAAGMFLACAAVPRLALALLLAVAAASLVLATLLKLAAFAAVAFTRPGARRPYGRGRPARLPVISVLIPLYREDGIAQRLLTRLARLDYPRELTDILLVTEADDTVTRKALAASALPGWMRVIEVPAGQLRTKPRALNYALNFARGSIVGVWDAEDMPEPAQLHRVADSFASAAPEVACLQGALDYYNQRQNWLSRAFAIEYAGWFRAVLPGLARLGLVVPLGGTTLFFRRPALEAVGGWDAHNVTEDADLGVRLARRGYRTEILDTVTYEEPNARPGPWIRQRSRWLKGYAITWASHNRRPAVLLRELGPARFLGLQVLFLGTLLQVALAPVLWLLWLAPFEMAEVLPGLPTGAVMAWFALSCLGAEALNMTINLWAVRRAGHRHLMPWVPLMLAYFPLASVAAARALWEMLWRPFHWEKTQHGIFDVDSAGDAAVLQLQAPRGIAPRTGEPPQGGPGRLPPLILLNPSRVGTARAPSAEPPDARRIAALIPRAAREAG
jgi:cellulose synthase/poly-beta-1,6-N-acetylglucosamine synthase-like glycosyltransferase